MKAVLNSQMKEKFDQQIKRGFHMSVPSAQRKKTEWDVSKKHFMHTKIVWKYKNKR